MSGSNPTEREARLADALRANLGRRKQRQRQMEELERWRAGDAPDDDGAACETLERAPDGKS